jgi:hypothetical protein
MPIFVQGSCPPKYPQILDWRRMILVIRPLQNVISISQGIEYPVPNKPRKCSPDYQAQNSKYPVEYASMIKEPIKKPDKLKEVLIWKTIIDATDMEMTILQQQNST